MENLHEKQMERCKDIAQKITHQKGIYVSHIDVWKAFYMPTIKIGSTIKKLRLNTEHWRIGGKNNPLKAKDLFKRTK